MGRGDRSTVRWRNERIKAKKRREKRNAERNREATAQPPTPRPAR